MNLNFTGRKKKMCEKKYSIIEINLFRPTKKSYPEFDYEKICKDYLKEDDSSGEDERFHDRAAEELVKRLNAKYGTKRDKKGRRLRFGDADDFMDKTVGYDLSDPFIDDTEAYDEQVPSTMDTAKGGFYVNRGRLDFRLKYMDDSDNDDEGPPKRKTSEKKRAITDDDDEDENKSNRDDNNEDIEADMLKASTSKGTDTVETGISVMGMGYDEQLKRENTDPTLRLSSNGAPPMNKRSIKQTLIKRRRLIGQPPTMKLTPSPTVKAALGVKRKLKNPMKKVAGNMNEEELDNFLKDMVGGHEIPFDETMRQAIKDLKNESALTPKPSVSISTGGSIADEHESCATTSSSTSNEDNISSPVKRSRLQSVTPEINTGITGTLPTAGSNVKELEQISVLSPKLTEMIETYKKRTSEFGAPNKKIRLPPSLVDLCIGIEHQCNSDGLTHAQKTRVFDSLANWVLVQRNSLYIRMKMQKEKKEASSTIEGSFGLPSNNTDVPVSSVGITSSVVVEGSKKVLDNISGSPVASVQKSTIASSETHITMASPKSSSQNSTIFKNPNQTLPNTKIEAVHPSKVTSKETMIEKAGSSSAMKTTVNGLPKTSNNTSSSHPSRQSASSSSTKKMNAVTNASQLSLPQAQLLSAFAASNNPQMLALMSAVLQQQAVAQSDAQQQRQLAAALATLKMQSVLAANACQSPELLRQYQVLMNTLNKSSLTSTSSTVASSSSSRSKHMNNNNSSNTNIQSKQCPSTLQLPLLKQQNSNSSHSGILDSKSTATTGVQSHHQKQSTSNIQSTLQTKEINSNLLKNLQKMNRLDNTFRNPKAVSSFKSSTSVMKNVVAKASSTEREKKSSSTAASAPSLLSSSSSSSSGSQPFKQHSKTSNINLGQASQFSKSTIPFNKLSKSSAEFSSKSIKASHVTSVGSSRQSKDSSQRNQSSKVPSKSSAANIASHLEKTKALELINTAAEALQIAIQEAVPADEDFEPLRKRPALEGVSLNERKFNWTEKLRVSLKTMVNTFFDSLNGHLTQNDLASKLAQYLHSCVFPLFKGAIAFTDFYNELASLVPERLYLLSLPEMKEYCKKSKKISETNAAGSTGLHNVSITKGTTLQESSVVKSHRLSSSSGPSPSVSNLKTKPTLAESIAQINRVNSVKHSETRKSNEINVKSTTENQA